MSDMARAFIENEAQDEGFSAAGEPIPRGSYHVEITKVQRVLESRSGTSVSPVFELTIRGDSKHAGRKAFVLVPFANPFDPEVKEKFYNMSSTLTRIIGGPVNTDVDPKNYDSLTSAAAAFYDFESWEGCEFQAELSVESVEKQLRDAQKQGRELTEAQKENIRPQNRLVGWHRLQHEAPEKKDFQVFG